MQPDFVEASSTQKTEVEAVAPTRPKADKAQTRRLGPYETRMSGDCLRPFLPGEAHFEHCRKMIGTYLAGAIVVLGENLKFKKSKPSRGWFAVIPFLIPC